MRKARLSDRQLAAAIGALLFLAASVPAFFVRQPPLQDYAEHVAASAMAMRPESYPEYVFNGFAKTNSAFVAFACLAGKVVGVERAAFAFYLVVLAVNALSLPWFVLHFGGRERMKVAALLGLPFVHNWFVSMGMLNFSLGVSLSLMALVALDRQRARPSVRSGLAAAGWLLVTWYAHPVPVLVVGLLVLVHVASRAAEGTAAVAARALFPPLAPVSVAVAVSVVTHWLGTVRPPGSGAATSFQTPLWLVYDLWAHWAYGYTILSVTSLALLALLAVFAAARLRAPVPFFGPASVLVLGALYAAAPYQTVGIGYAGSRVIPYLWMAALLRVPERVGRVLEAVLAACSLLYAAGMAVDTVRLAREEDEAAAGASAVPRGARLDVFLFSPRGISRNTWSLSTAWGEYVVRAGAHTWEMPGDTPSLPFRWRAPPPARLETNAHHRFTDRMRTEQAYCASREESGLGTSSCGAQWREEWAQYYRDVDPFIDALVLWDPPADALERVPATWQPAFHARRLWVFERGERTARAASGKEPDLDVDAARGAAGGR